MYKKCMFKKEKTNRKCIFKSKYMDLDIENMSEEEFEKISRKIYSSIVLRTGGGVILFILCIIALIIGGKYAW